MNKETLKQLTDAHSWLGLIISGALMIVFICGTLSFFKSNIDVWQQYHHQTQPLPERILSPGEISKILDEQGYKIPSDHRVMLLFPTDDAPQYRAIFSTEEANGRHARHQIFFDPVSGKVLKNVNNKYTLSDFLYKLHIDLNIPAGTEIVGIVSLIFLVIVFSGILIHLKKLIINFYQYRTRKTKDTYLDGHNLIGVTSLPYTFMYALTGVMFNLSIIYQASFGIFVFQGDIDTLSTVSGFTAPDNITVSGQPMKWQNIDLAIEHANQQLPGAKTYLTKIWGFGDQNAQMQLRLIDTNSVTERLTIDYSLNTDKTVAISKNVHVLDNPVQGAYHVLKQLHYGNFGGITLQFIYFFLGLACCYLILTGNLIWLEKRSINRKQNQRSLHFVKAMTLCLSIGTLSAVAMSFIAVRFLPDVFTRTDALPYIFSAVLVLSFIHAFGFNNSRKIMIQQAMFASVLFIICPVYDTVIVILDVLQAELFATTTPSALLNLMLVNVACVLVSIFCLVFAYYKK